jgi:transcriptional regulator with XRE-family HTH domain
VAIRAIRGSVGPLIRARRIERQWSQLALALDAGVSARHLSFVELGKARPSPELIVLLADRLGVTLRERNTWLLAAGFAPRYTETPLDGTALRRISTSVQTLLDAHEPYPAAALDRNWTAQLYNRASLRLAEGIPEHARGTPTNIFRVSLHPDGFAPRTRNFSDWSAYLLRQLDLLITRTRSPELIALAAEIEQWPDIPPRVQWSRTTSDGDTPVMPWTVEHGGVELSFFTVLATIGTPLDVTLDELTIEFFFAADDSTSRYVHERWGRSQSKDAG